MSLSVEEEHEKRRGADEADEAERAVAHGHHGSADRRWYFLVTVLDAYSQSVVHWALLTSMRAADVRLVIQEALERTGANPQIVTDNGSPFTAGEFKQLVRRFELEHFRIRTYRPESNGVSERFHRADRCE